MKKIKEYILSLFINISKVKENERDVYLEQVYMSEYNRKL